MQLPAVGSAVDVEKFAGSYYKATVQEVDGDQMLVHYHGFGDNWDQWVGVEKLKGYVEQQSEPRETAPDVDEDSMPRDRPSDRFSREVKSSDTLGDSNVRRRQRLSVRRENERAAASVPVSDHPAWRETPTTTAGSREASRRVGTAGSNGESTLRFDARVDRRVAEVERVQQDLAEERASNFELLKELQAQNAELAEAVKHLLDNEESSKGEIASRFIDMKHNIGELADNLEKHRRQVDEMRAPLTKNSTDISNLHEEVAEGLRQVSGRGQEIQEIRGENRDQGEAMKTLMDMLDETLTAQDGALLASDMQAAFKAADSELAQELESTLEAASIATTDKIASAISTTREVEERIEGKLAEAAMAEQSRGDAVSSRLDALAGQIQSVEASAADARAQLIADVRQLEKDLTATIIKDVEIVKETMDRISADVDRRISGLEEVMVTKIDTLQTNADIALSKVHNNQDSLQQHVARLSEKLDSSLDSMSETMKTQLAQLDERHSATSRGLERRFDKEITGLSDRLAGEIERVDHKFNSEIRNLEDVVHGSTSKLDDAINVLDTKLTRTVHDLNASVGKQCEGMDAQLREFSGQVDTSFQDINQSFDSLTTDIQKFVVESGLDKEIMHAAISRIDAKFAAVEDLWTEVDAQRKHFNDLCSANHEELLADLVQQKNDASAQTTRFADALSTLRQSVTTASQEQENRIAEISNSSREKYDNLKEDTHQAQIALDSRIATCEHSTDLTLARAQEIGTRLERAMEDTAESLTVKVESESRKVKVLCDSIEKRLGNVVSQVQEDARQGRQSLSDQLTQKEKQLNEAVGSLQTKYSGLEKKIEGQVRFHSEEFKALQACTNKLEQSFEDLERNLSTERLEAHNATELVKSELTATIKATSRERADHLSVLEAQLKELEKSRNQIVGNFDSERAAVAAQFSEIKASNETTVTELERCISDLQTDSARTIKDLSQLVKSTDSKLGDELANVDARIRELQRQQRENERSTKEAVHFMKLGLEQRIENMQGNLVSQIEAAEGKLRERSSALEKRTTEFRVESQSRWEALELAADAHSVQRTKSEDGLRETVKTLAGAVRDNKKQLSDTISELQRTVSNEKTSVAHQLEDAKATANREAVRLDKAVTALVTNFTEKHDSLDKRLESQTISQAETTTSLQNTLAEEVAGLRKALGEVQDAVVAQAPDIADTLDVVQRELRQCKATSEMTTNELQSAIDALAAKVATVQEAADAGVVEATRSVRQLIGTEVARLVTGHKTMQESLTAQLSELRSQLQSSTDAQEHQFASLQNLVAATDEKVRQDLRILQGTVDEQNDNHRSIHETLSKKFTNILDMHASRITAQQQHIDDVSRTLEARTSEKNAKQDARMDDLAGAQLGHHKHFTDALMRLEVLFTDLNNEQNSKFETQINQVQDRLHRADVRSKEQGQRHGVQLEELAAEVAESNQRLTALCTNIDVQTTEAYNALDARMASKNDHFTASLKLADEDVAKKYELHEQKLANFGSRLDSGLKELTAQLSTWCKTTEMKHQSQDEIIDRNFDHLQEMNKDLDRRLVDKHYELRAQCENIARTCQDKFAGQSDALQSLDSNLAKRIANVEVLVERHRLSTQERIDEVDTELEHKVEGLCKRLDNHEADVAKQLAGAVSRCDRSDQKIDRAVANSDEKIVRQREHIDEVAVKVHTLLTERLEEQEKSWRETCAAVDNKHQNAFGQQTDAFDKLRVQLKTDQAALESSHLQLETRLEHRIAQQATRAEEHYNLFNRLCRESLDATNAVATASEKRGVQLDETIGKHYLELSGQTAELARHFAGIEDRLRFCTDTTNAFAEKLDGQHATFTEACLKLNTAIVSLHSSHEDNATGLVEQKREMESQTAALHKQILQLEQDGSSWQEQCKTDFASTADKIDEQHSVFTAACLKLNEAVVALHSGNETSANAVTKLRADLNATTEATKTSLNEQARSIAEVGKALRHEASKAAHRLTDLAADITSREERLARQNAQTAENAAHDIQRTMDKLDSQHQTFTKAALKLNDGLVALDAAQLAGNQTLEEMREEMKAVVARAMEAAKSCLHEFEEQIASATAVQDNMAMGAALRDIRISEIESATRELDDRVHEGLEGPDGALARLNEWEVDAHLADLTQGL